MAEIMYVDWDGLVYYDTRSKQYIKDIVDQTIKFGGHYTVEDVPAPGFETLHVAYKITDKFVVSPETAYFVKTCAGKTFEAGTVILVVEDGDSDTYRFDILFEAYSGVPLTPGGEIDLSNYYTKAQVNDLLSGKVAFEELSNYYLKTETDNKLADKADKSDLDGLATEEFVATAINAIEVPDVSTLATKEELEVVQTTAGSNSVKLFAVESELFDINQKLDELVEPDLSGYAKEEDLNTVSLNVEEIGKTVSKNTVDIETLDDAVANNTGAVEALRGEVTEVSEKVTDLQEAVNNISIPDNYVTDEELEAKGYITEHQDISHLATKDEIPSIEGLATEQFVTDKISEIDIPEVPTKVSEIENDAGYITANDIPETDLSNYYNKTETQNLVDDAVKAIIVPEVPTNVSAFTNDANYTTLAEVATQGYLTSIPDEYVTSEELAQEGFLKEHQSLEGYVKDTELNDAIDAVEYKIVTKTSELENDAGFVTEGSLPAFVKPDDITDFVTLTEVEEAGFIKSIPDEYVTETELANRQFVTEESLGQKGFITDVSNKADKDHTHSYNDLTDLPTIPSIEGLATKDYVDEAVANIDVPAVDTTNLLTKDEANTLLATKANDVPFADDYRVGTALGGFVADESLQGMTVVQILTKLLGLSLYIPPTGNVPEGTTPTVENIITNEVPIYHLSNAGEPAGGNFEYKIMTVTEGAQDNQNAAFMYQIVDEKGAAIESGYQIVTEELDEGYLTVYVPETVTNFSIRIFDGIGGSWVTPEWGMIENSNYHLDGYKVYTADPSYDIYERMTIRVVIEN